MAATKTTTAARAKKAEPHAQAEDLQPGPDLLDYLRDYAREKPEIAALWCFGIGFVLGWKLKIW
jgi:hypothetical protein